MQAVFNKTKVKTWIKKTHKNSSFGYGHGYITDGCAMLVDEPHMHPTILEVFGTLTPEWFPSLIGRLTTGECARSETYFVSFHPS